jgi:hypothetical protein
MNCFVDTGDPRIWDSCLHRSSSGLPEPFVRKMWGIYAKISATVRDKAMIIDSHIP